MVTPPYGPNFYPRPPRGGRRKIIFDTIAYWQFLPTPSARRATKEATKTHERNLISTHALREEGDVFCLTNYDTTMEISTHALREEGDIPTGIGKLDRYLFLPTPSARRATKRGAYRSYFFAISTHALREEGDR